jgi:archaellum biogenesis ATPase FlaH
MAKAKPKAKKTEKKSIINDELFTSAFDALNECKNLTVVPVSPSIDYRLGGGIPEGSFVLIRSRQKVGKTSCSMQIAQNALMQGRIVIFVDAERRLTASKYFQIEGFDINNPNFRIMRSKNGNILSGEEIYEEVIKMMKMPEYYGAVFIIDSFSRIIPLATIDDSEVRGDRRDTAPKLNEDFCKKAGNILRINNCILIGIQHLMVDTSPMGMGKLVPKGGNGLEYDADIVLESKHRQLNLSGESIALAKDEEELDGQMVRWDIPYNKLLAPYVAKENDFKVLNYYKFGYGCWWAKEAIEVLKMVGLVVQGGAYYTFMTEKISEKVQGAQKALDLVEQNRSYFEKILEDYYKETYNVSFAFTKPEVENEEE